MRESPQDELAELISIYRQKGLSERTARQVAIELTEHDALVAHAEAELGIAPDDLVSPTHAAAASAVSFLTGAALPLVAILLPPPTWRVGVTIVVVLLALALAGYVSASLGDSPRRIAVIRVVLGGAAGLGLTYLIGHLFGTSVS